MPAHNDIALDPLFAEAIENLPHGFAILDKDARVLVINSISLRRFPTFYGELMKGSTYLDALRNSTARNWPEGTPEQREAIVQKFYNAYLSGEAYEAKTEDGEIVRAHYKPLSGGRKIAINVEITDLRDRERELKRLQAETVAASNAKSAFLANMSHEIRTPLNGIMGMAQVLESGELAPQQRDQVATILDSGKTLMSILNDVLDLSKIESGRFDIAPEDNDLMHVMRGLQRLWKPKADEAGLTFTLGFDSELPQLVRFDAVRVRQCVSNLISNAIKFTAQGRVDVYVSAAAPRSDGQRLIMVSVRDSGLGLDEETQGRLFQPFMQADASTSRQFGGTGLGLSIVRKLAGLMGGDASVDSSLGRGSTFTFSFLAAPAEAPVIAPRRATVAGDPAGTGDFQELKILLVDDHPVNRKVASLLLTPFNPTIVEACDGREALAALTAETFDLVLLDMHMPVMDGPATIAAVRGSDAPFRDVAIVALTADAMSGDRERYLQMGANGYLSKPLSMDDLVAELTRVRREVGDASRAAA